MEFTDVESTKLYPHSSSRRVWRTPVDDAGLLQRRTPVTPKSRAPHYESPCFAVTPGSISPGMGLNPTLQRPTELEHSNGARLPVGPGSKQCQYTIGAGADQATAVQSRPHISGVLDKTTGSLLTLVPTSHKRYQHHVCHPSETTPINQRAANWTEFL